MKHFGLVEWLRPGEYARAESVMEDLRIVGCHRLRMEISWADWHREGVAGWYDWLLPRLSREVELLPCFHFTPPSLGVRPAIASPPRDPKAYADWLDVMITRYGAHFDSVELWNEPNNLSEWDWNCDPEWQIFGAMIGGAAYWAKVCGKRTVLGGMSPIDPHWLQLMARQGVLENIDIVGIHAFPAHEGIHWRGWKEVLQTVRGALAACGCDQPVWVTETGHSTWRHDEFRQAQAFVEAMEAPAERVYWYGMQDLNPAESTIDGFHVDEREYHFGVKHANGCLKLLYRLLATGGYPCVRGVVSRASRQSSPPARKAALIIGGAGFIGASLAGRLAQAGTPVQIYDNLSGADSLENLTRLDGQAIPGIEMTPGDLRDTPALGDMLKNASAVYHLGAPVSAQACAEQPHHAHDIICGATVRLMETLAGLPAPPPLIYVSTHKAYGRLAPVTLVFRETRCEPVEESLRLFGIPEETPLRPDDVYGAARAAAEYLVLAYARQYALPATVLRFSTVYGPRQRPARDSAWLAALCAHVATGHPLTVFGDGRQVRDPLYIDDAVDALETACRRIENLRLRVFNVGGGPENAISLLELIDLIGSWGYTHELQWARPRALEQNWFTADIRRFWAATRWRPETGLAQGLHKTLEAWAARPQPSPDAGTPAGPSVPREEFAYASSRG